MVELTSEDLELLKGSTTFATLVTLREDGSPHASITWIDAEDGLVLVNTAEGRSKDRNLRRDPRVTLLVTDPSFYRWISIDGIVADTVGEPRALEHIDELSRRYDGKPWTPVEGQVRAIFRIRPERIHRYQD
jgi:PPOX class probable F420-dependent enzyme